jgi:hypothetical protein
MIIYLLVSYAQYAPVNPRWFGMPLVFGFYSLPYVGSVWLLLVLPLFCAIRHRSRFWAWYITPPSFALIGFVVMSFLFKFSYNHTTSRIAWLAALVGGATGLACVIWQRRLASQLNLSSVAPCYPIEPTRQGE